MFVLFLFLAVVGYYSWTKLAIDAYPDIADTTVQVVTQVPGLAAEEIEQHKHPYRKGDERYAGTERDAKQKYFRPFDSRIGFR